MGRGAMPDDNVSLEEMIAIERVAQELWERATKGTSSRMAIFERPRQAGMAQPRRDRGHHLAQVGRRTLTGAFSYSATKLRACGAAAHEMSVSPSPRGVLNEVPGPDYCRHVGRMRTEAAAAEQRGCTV